MVVAVVVVMMIGFEGAIYRSRHINDRGLEVSEENSNANNVSEVV